MYPISETNRCHLFIRIAEEIWQHIIYNHNAGINVSEIGITKDIIALIRTHFKTVPNFGVWANPGFKESIYGSDIDIFVETNTGDFVWYALQAKALQLNGTYSDMAGIRNGEYQWQKLEKLEELSGCITKYLLYNGVENYHFRGTDKCKNPFDETQFGCSLVDKDIVKSVSLSKTPTFYDFYPKDAQPWRVIVCCLQDTTKNTLLNLSQIKRAINYYPESFGNTNILNEKESGKKSNDYEENAINTFSEKVGRKPHYRIVVRTTKSLSK